MKEATDQMTSVFQAVIDDSGNGPLHDMLLLIAAIAIVWDVLGGR